jgi:hypothetical protein
MRIQKSPIGLQRSRGVAVFCLASLSDAAKQIELLAGLADAPVRIRAIDGRKMFPPQEFAGTIAEIGERAQKLNLDGYNIYMVAQPTGSLTTGFVNDGDVTGVRCFYADGDEAPLPTDWHLEPTFTLEHSETGRWWAFWSLHGLSNLETLRTWIKRIAANYGADPSVCNPARIVRLAGFDRWKEGENFGPYRLRVLSGRTSDEWEHQGLPEVPQHAPAVRPDYHGSQDVISLDRLRRLLAYISPAEREVWRNGCFAIRDAIVVNEASAPVDQADTFALFDHWSSGQLWENAVDPKLPQCDFGAYQGTEDCEILWNGPHGAGAYDVGIGSLVGLAKVHAAKQGVTVPTNLCRPGAPERIHSPPFQSVLPVATDTPAVPLSDWPSGLCDWADLQDSPPPRWLAKGLIGLKSFGIWAGGQGSLKTQDMLALAVCAITGTPFYGHEITETGPVLFMCLEDDEHFKLRVHAVCDAMGIDPAALKGRLFRFSPDDAVLRDNQKGCSATIRPT